MSSFQQHRKPRQRLSLIKSKDKKPWKKRKLNQSGDRGFPWAKFDGEFHIPGYNYAGPGTDLSKRLDKNDKPLPGFEPVNALDAVALQHDLNYREAGNDMAKQRAADDLMVKQINELPTNNVSWKERAMRWAAKKIIATKVKLGVALMPS